VVLPVSERVNADFGEAGKWNLAAKLALLLWDTDIDLVFLNAGSQPRSYGFDLARNLTSSLAVHGELAWFEALDRGFPTAGGQVEVARASVASGLLGARYLSPTLTTFIVEYYHGGAGLREDEAASFYDEVRRATAAGPEAGAMLAELDQLRRRTFLTSLPMTDYLHLRVSQKEPFGLVYLTPGVTSIVNLLDGSLLLVPEVEYSPRTDLELRLRAAFLIGGRDTDFGERRNDSRVELRGRWFF
jgi:hypothetical protein